MIHDRAIRCKSCNCFKNETRSVSTREGIKHYCSRCGFDLTEVANKTLAEQYIFVIILLACIVAAIIVLVISYCSGDYTTFNKISGAIEIGLSLAGIIILATKLVR